MTTTRSKLREHILLDILYDILLRKGAFLVVHRLLQERDSKRKSTHIIKRVLFPRGYIST